MDRSLFVLLVLCGAPPAGAQCTPDWLPLGEVIGNPGRVNASTVWDPDGQGPRTPVLVVGGEFRLAGDVPAVNVAAWDGAQWRRLGSGEIGTVRGLAVYGGQLVAAWCSELDQQPPGAGVSVWNGQSWSALEPNLLIKPDHVIVHNGELYAGGSTLAGGAVERWTGTQWALLPDWPCSPRQQVGAMASYYGSLVVAPVSSSGICVNAWDGRSWRDITGGLSPYQAPGAGIKSFAVFNDLLIGAGNVCQSGECGFVAWNGRSWSVMGSGQSAPTALGVYESALFAGGSIATAQGSAALARWSGQAWVPIAAQPSADIASLTAYGSDLTISGSFNRFDGLRLNSVALFDGAEFRGADRGVDVSLGAAVRAFLDDGASLWVGGAFTSAGGVQSPNVARWDGATWAAAGDPIVGLNGEVRALVSYRGRIVAGGRFSSLVAQWDGAAWQPLGGPGQPGTSGQVAALATVGSDLFAMGVIRLANGQTWSMAKWDGTSWSIFGSGTIANPTAMVASGPDLWVSGTLAIPGAQPGEGVARWDGSSWSGIGGCGGGTVHALAVHNGSLVAGGTFTSIGGAAAPRVARWDGASWHALGTGFPRPNDNITTLAVNGPDLFALGGLTSTGGQWYNYISRWDGSQWTPVGQGLQGRVIHTYDFAAASFNGQLVVGGEFAGAGGEFSPALARWGCACYANCDGSAIPPLLNVSDLVCFLGRFATGDPYANCDGSTTPPTLNVSDFLCFMQRYATGCP